MIVGDYLIFRNGLRLLIDSQENFKVVSEVADLLEATSEIARLRPDVLLVDSDEVINGEFSKFLASACKGIPAIVLTNTKNAQTHQRYLLMGASGVVTRKQEAGVLFKAIEKVNADDLWFKREVMKKTIEKLIRDKHDAPQKIYTGKYDSLTDREREVLSSICKGMKNKEIAESLKITETTVRHHLTSIFEKLNVKSRLALAILAFNEGLVEVPPKGSSSSHDV